MYSSQERHGYIRESLVSFVEANRQIFQKYVMTGTFEEHVSAMKRQGVWATQLEVFAAASLYQLPVYLCSPHPTTHQYRWMMYEPVDRADLVFEGDAQRALATNKHIELCHTGGDHFDCISDKDNAIPTIPPQLNTHSKSSFNIE